MKFIGDMHGTEYKMDLIFSWLCEWIPIGIPTIIPHDLPKDHPMPCHEGVWEYRYFMFILYTNGIH